MPLQYQLSSKHIAILRRFKFGSHDIGRCYDKAVSLCSALIDTSLTSIWMPVSQGIALMVILSESVSTLKMYALRHSFSGNSEVHWTHCIYKQSYAYFLIILFFFLLSNNNLGTWRQSFFLNEIEIVVFISPSAVLLHRQRKLLLLIQ